MANHVLQSTEPCSMLHRAVDGRQVKEGHKSSTVISLHDPLIELSRLPNGECGESQRDNP